MKMKHLLSLLMIAPAILNAQNTCSTALLVTPGSYIVDTIDGDVSPTSCLASGETAGEWYVYTASNNYNLVVTTDLAVNSGGDTRFQVYNGNCGSLTCYAGDDDSGNGYLSYDEFVVYAGQTYYIVFDNKWSPNGFTFEIQENPYVEPVLPPISFTSGTVATSGNYSIAVTDMNGDYLDDIISVSGNQVQILYQQTSGGFVPTTIATSDADFNPSWSMAIGDFDKNGFNDLLYGGGSGVTFMKANADGTAYEEISGPEYVFSQRSNFVDINNDGHLDAFVCHDVDPNVYYLNDGSGNLLFHQGGLGDFPEGGNYGSIWVDYDNDGDQDLFIAKCRGGGSDAKYNELHRNDGNGVFTDVSISSNMRDPVQTWSSAWNDYDNDGDLDAIIGASSLADGHHKFMSNNGDGTFSDITTGSGWDIYNSLSVEYYSFDFDNDGYADVFGGNNNIMFNNGDLTFDNQVYSINTGAVGDLNNDGFLDIQNGSTVYYNDGNANNWVKINLKGIASNYNGIGARVELYTANGRQIRNVQSGVGFKYMHTLNVHFGIGTQTAIDSILIKWPSGTIDNIINPDINSTVHVVEGGHPLSTLVLNGKKVSLFPNPTTTDLMIENLEVEEVNSISIHSYAGQEVMRLEATKEPINVSALNNGLYVVTIHLKNGEKYSETFIKK